MSQIEIQLSVPQAEAFRLGKDLFDANGFQAGMTRRITDGAVITLARAPIEKRGTGVGGVVLDVILSLSEHVLGAAVYDWLKGRIADHPGVKIIIQQKEYNFENGDLKQLIETSIDVEKK
jgi:hypothetical protein